MDREPVEGKQPLDQATKKSRLNPAYVRFSIDFKPDTYQKLKDLSQKRHSTIAGEVRRGVDMIIMGQRIKDKFDRGEALDPLESQLLQLYLLA